jgi:hypothetical protein
LGSEIIIGGLLTEEAKHDLSWQCWLKHVSYLHILTQHVISRSELARLRLLIEEHQIAFAQVNF